MQTTKHKRLGDRLRDLIRESGITQARLAELTGVEQSVFSQFLRGCGLSMHTLERLEAVVDFQLSLKGRASR